jgi:uncharacterized protein DUF2752
LRSRLGGLLLACCALGILGVAAHLSPDPSGRGTHQQLGLPACSFLTITGVPCPSCGLTTSFAALAHGEPALAFSANPVGLLLFTLTLLSIPLGLGLYAKKLGLNSVFYSRWFDRIGLAVLGLWLGTWALRLAHLVMR